MDEEHCKWCGEYVNIGGLIGVNTNQCPKCGKPIFVVVFGSLSSGTVFETDEEGRFCKLDAGTAVCVESGSFTDGSGIGSSVSFEADETVYPY